jgi:serine protease Do
VRRLTLILPVILLLLAGSARAEYDRRTPVVEAVEKASPAVVNIRTEQIVNRRSTPFFGFDDPFFEDFFRDLAPPRTYTTEALGSGVVVDPRGYILTNAHVIRKASRIYAALPGRDRELEAELVGMDESIDLAVVKIDTGSALPFLPPGNSGDVMVGETVIAIGNPLGLGHSITTGIVSAPQRRISMGNGNFSNFIQTDALINPGNSGGPLININGHLIGINTAIARQAQGIGFAIPVDTVKRVLDDLITLGRVRRSFSGILPAPVGEKFTESLGRGGVLVNRVSPGSPADSAGIRFGDVILFVAGDVVTSPGEYNSLLRTYTPGTRVALEIMRGSDRKKLALNLAEVPEDYAREYSAGVFGLEISDAEGGAVISRIHKDSPAEKIGLEKGDLVAGVEGEDVEDSEGFYALVKKYMGREPMRFLVFRGRRGYYVELP